MSTWGIVVSIISVVFTLNVILAAIMVFFERRSPSSTWAWLFVLFFIPIVGFLVYLIFGRNTGKQKAFGPKIENDERAIKDFIKNNESLSKEFERQCFSNDGIALGEDYKELLNFATLNLNTGSLMTYNNDMTHFIDGKDKFRALIKDIKEAKKFIHMEYYILRGDELGKTIVDELTKKAAMGVKVRLMYDYMGNFTLPKNFFDKLLPIYCYSLQLYFEQLRSKQQILW